MIRFGLAVVGCALGALGWAQSARIGGVEFDASGFLPFDSGVPELSEVGIDFGNRHTRAHQVVEYFKVVAETSDRVVLLDHSDPAFFSPGGRQFVQAVVSSPENLRRMETLMEGQQRKRNAPSLVSDADLEEMPLVVWMGYGVHGNEASATEAGLALLYLLAAGEGAFVERLLQDAVILIDPIYNPDGIDRFVNWVNDNRGRYATTDPSDREHNSPWPGGRTNHYGFDLNRDWMPASQISSQLRLLAWHDWVPHVTTDFHEMGGSSTYFFQPGEQERVNPFTPQANQDLTAAIAEFHAIELENRGQIYFTGERFDDFYVGKGSTYPDVNGSIGILFEQASSRALRADTINGELTYAATVGNQVAMSISSLKGSHALRNELKAFQRDFFAGASEVAREGGVAAHALSGDTFQLAAAEGLLSYHSIESFRSGDELIVPTDQPQARMIASLFDRRTEFEDDRFYDVSTWNLAMAMNLGHEALSSVPEALPMDQSGVEPIDLDAPAYVLRWDAHRAWEVLERAHREGFQARYLTRDLTSREGAPELRRGDVILIRGDSRVEPLIFEAAQVGATIEAIPALDGPGVPVSLGGPSAVVLDAPRVAIVHGPGGSVNDSGSLWWQLDAGWGELGMEVSVVDPGDLAGGLDRYDTIVLAGSLSSSIEGPLTSWVNSGGHLIAIESGVGWAVSADLTDLRPASYRPDLDGLPYGELSRESARHRIAGTFFEVELDTTHPLATGLGPTIPVFKTTSTVYSGSRQPGANVGFYAQEPVLAGYVSAEQLDFVRGRAAFVSESAGRGRVTCITDLPGFRAYVTGPNKLLTNAIFLGSAL